jgi:hypothetical protein
MQKEVLISVIIGISLGLIVTYGIYQVKKQVTSPTPTDVTAEMDSNENDLIETGLMLTSPEDGLVQEKSQIKVAGTTIQPESFVVVFVDNQETILQSDSTGGFSTNLELTDGEHVITVVSVNQDGWTETAERLVVISDLFSQSQLPATTTAQIPAEEGEEEVVKEATTQAILDRINKKLTQEEQEQLDKTIEQLAVKRGAMIGQVERVTEEALTITTTQGTVILATDEELEIKKSNKDIALDQIGVDDWLLVMGVTDGTQITPEYIFVSSTTLRPKPHSVVLGTLSEINKSSLSVTSRADGEITNFNISNKTEYQDVDAKDAKLNQFSTDLTVLGIGYEEVNKTETTQVLTTLRALAVFED